MNRRQLITSALAVAVAPALPAFAPIPSFDVRWLYTFADGSRIRGRLHDCRDTVLGAMEQAHVEEWMRRRRTSVVNIEAY